MALSTLRDLIDKHFSEDELRGLCFDVDVEYENLPGDARIVKAQSLIQHCLRHNQLPALGIRLRQLRATATWPDCDALQEEWRTLQQTRDNLSALLDGEQLEAALAPLRLKEADLLTRLIGSEVMILGNEATIVGERGVVTEQAENIVTGDNNHIGHIVNIYHESANGRIPTPQLRQAIAAYVRWVDNSYGRIRLRGLSDREHDIPDPDLPDVYVSLVAQKEVRQWRERDTDQEQQPIDMSQLLAQGNRLVITGAPGSGKTTFLRHIAHLLAHAIYTGDETAVRQQLNLTGPLPLPIYLSLGDYHRYRQQPGAGTLIDFISYTLIRQHGVYNLPDDFFAQLLARRNTVCLLLDSLDEIPHEDGRSRAIKDVIDLADNDIGQLIVASRDHAYVGRVMLPRAFHRFIVQPMREEQIAALTRRWCKAVYPPQVALDEANKLQGEIAALEAIRNEQGEVPLVDTPLMVTIVAIVHWNNRVLPQQRAALYEKCVAALLAEQHKEDEGQGQSRPDLEKRGGSLDAKRGQLATLAYEMMSSRKDKDAGRTISRTQLETWLLPLFRQIAGAEAAPQKLEAFRVAMCDRASILHERGGLHEFTHLTFQEFLCAYHLAGNASPAEIAAFFQAEDRVLHSWWRETILLTIGYLGKNAIGQSLTLVQKMVSLFPDSAAGLAAAELAAAGLLELEAPAPDARREAHDRLVALLTDPDFSAPLALRALAGRTLSRLSDKRRGVGVIEKDGILLPDIAWSGAVPMGDYVYQLARYPITYAQFQTFMDAADRDDARWWRDMPARAKEWGEQAFPYANHPRERVSWYQAVAFCRWLSDKLKQEITLPTEQQWETAARWNGAKADDRAYPWGDTFDKTKANINEGGIRQTTAVGIYPSGKNEALELYDLSGNVWEWCLNKYDEPEETAVDQSNQQRVLRGGSWNLYRYAARAAYRGYDFSPDNRYNDVGFRVVVRRPPSQSHL